MTPLLALLLLVAEADEPPRAERPHYVLEGVEVVGNTTTEDYIVFRHVDLVLDAPLDETQIELVRLRLLRVGYFKNVVMQLTPGTQRGRVVLIIKVEERGTFLISDVNLGTSDRYPFWAGIGATEWNFLGRGFVVGGAFVASADQVSYRLHFTEPSLFGSHMLGAIALHYTFGEELLAGSTAEVLRYQRVGGVATWGIAAGSVDRFFVAARVEGLDGVLPADRERTSGQTDPNLRLGSSALTSLALTYEHDSRDEAFFPTEGSLFAFSVEVGSRILLSSYDYSRYTLSFDQYFQPASDHVLRLRAQGGLVQGFAPFFLQFLRADTAYFASVIASGREEDRDFFSLRHTSFPRALGLNFNDTNTYDDVMISGGLEYAVPLFTDGETVYRGFVYGAFDVTHVTSVASAASATAEDLIFPMSFDLGVKLDTAVGVFTLSLSWLLDVLIP